jgi:hypothetical protein
VRRVVDVELDELHHCRVGLDGSESPRIHREENVQKIAFHQLPLWVRLAAALTLLNTWILIAEFVIDRYGIDEVLPFYRYGDICIWDIFVLAGIAVLFVRKSRVPRGAAPP